MTDGIREELNNPAGRLAHWLRRIEIQARTNKSSQNRSFLQTLADLRGAERDDLGAAVTFLGDLMRMPQKIKQSIVNSPDVSDTYLGFLPLIDRHLQNVLANLQNAGATIPGEGVYTALDVISEQLAKFAPEPEPDREELASISDAIQSLVDDLAESPLDPELSHFLIDELVNLRNAIAQFSLLGVAPIKDALAKFIGDVHLRESPDEVEDESEEVASFSERLKTIVKRIASALSFTANGIQVAGVVTEALSVGHIRF
jgi:hypothetical protein